ncbi:MAG: 5'-3' exonuclease H3TH domain-containing protein [Nitrospirota bacterium]
MNLYLIDGSSYFYRAYHAIKRLSTSKGFPTNAIYGFTSMILKIIRDKKPDGLAIVFDSPLPTERHRLYEQYKAHRPEMPDDLALQIPPIKEIITAFRIPSIEAPGCEADDLIGAAAKKAARQGAKVFIVSGDKDMMQLVDKAIVMYDPMKDLLIDEAAVKERFGMEPERIVEVMALTGDAVDNIPGVKGIGEKTAKDLLAEAGGLEELLAHPERIKNERHRKMIMENIDTIRLSKTLATIDIRLPVEIDPGDLVLAEPDWPALLRYFTEFELKSFMKLVPARGYAQRGSYITLTRREQLCEFLGLGSRG